MATLKSILRNRLKKRESKGMVKWLAQKKQPGQDIDHILESFMGMKKLNNYLLDIKMHDTHMKKHYPGAGRGETEEEFLESFIRSLDYWGDYTQHLEAENESLLKQLKSMGYKNAIREKSEI
jgi:hypothetical protein